MLQTSDPKLLPTSPDLAREEGSIQPFVVVGLGSILLLLGFTLNLGQLFSVATQAQSAADAASRAAANEIANQLLVNPDVGLDNLRAAARDMARRVVDQQRVFSAASTDLQVEFGAYDFREGTFSPRSSLIQPTAVRVTVQPASSGGDGALKLLLPTQGRTRAELSRSAVSALRTTNQIYLVDVSISFQDSIGLVKAALQRQISRLVESGGVERIGIIPFRNRVVESLVVGLVEPTDARVATTIHALDFEGVLCRAGGGFPLPTCAGTDLAGALDRALLMVALQGTHPANTVVNLLTDGEPCEAPRDLAASVILSPLPPRPTTVLEDPLGPETGGGSSVDEARAAAQRLCARASLNTIAIDTRGIGSGLCPSLEQMEGFVSLSAFSRDPLRVQPPNGPEQEVFFKETSRDDELMEEIACNFGRKFPSDTTPARLAGDLRRASSTLPPVTVR